MRSPRLFLKPLGLIAAIVALGAAVAFAVPSFPGAMGFGGNATGGRGGAIYHVTNLNDSGVGSFRDAVSASNRFIVFDVGGYIVLNSAVSVKSNLTIAGQTAPGQGIGILGREVSFNASSNVICRFVRFRQGDLDPDDGASGINILNSNLTIFDHCSIEFALYDTVDGSPCGNTTFQNSILADAIGQQFGAHMQQLAATSANTWINNLWVNLQNRQPLAKTFTQYVNNVIYNYIDGYTNENSAGVTYHDAVNNYFISGPASTVPSANWYQVNSNVHMYYAGNLLDQNRNGVLDGASTTPASATPLATPYFNNTLALATLSAANAYTYDIANAGTLPRDAMDSLVVSQILTLGQGTPGQGAGTSGPDADLYFSQIETGLPNGGYGTLSGGNTYLDTDQDGMPDYWEQAMGSNATLADGNVTAANGYTNVENYVNWLAGPHALAVKNTSVNVDLATYTLGLANPAFAVSSPVNGTVQLLGNGHTAQFTPAANFTGAASFAYSANGTPLAGNVAVVVAPSTPVQVPPVSSNFTPQPLTWKGDGSANAWDLSSLNWSNGTATVAYINGNNLTFDDTGSASPSITLSQNVTPGSVLVNSSQSYTLTGSGQLAGFMALTKQGTGSLTLNRSNSFIGGIFVNAGTLAVGNLTACEGMITLHGGTLEDAIGGNITNPITVTANSTFKVDSTCTWSGTVTGNSTLNLTGLSGHTLTLGGSTAGFYGGFSLGTNSGTFRLLGLFGSTLGSMGSAHAMFDVGTGSAALAIRNGNVTINFGALQGGSNTTVHGGTVGNTTFAIGNLNLNTTYSGAILDGDATNITILNKVGTGLLTLNGTSTYTGPTIVSSGTLLISGNLASTSSVDVLAGATLQLASGIIHAGSVTIESGATLAGNGTIAGPVVMNGTVNAALGGTLTINGNVTNNSVWRLTGGTRLAVNGTFTNNGVLDLITSGSGVPAVLVNHGTVLLASAVQVAQFGVSGGVATLQIQSYAGHNYQFQAATSLGSAWINLGSPQAGNGTVLTFTDSSLSGPQLFYRVTVSP